MYFLLRIMFKSLTNKERVFLQTIYIPTHLSTPFYIITRSSATIKRRREKEGCLIYRLGREKERKRKKRITLKRE